MISILWAWLLLPMIIIVVRFSTVYSKKHNIKIAAKDAFSLGFIVLISNFLILSLILSIFGKPILIDEQITTSTYDLVGTSIDGDNFYLAQEEDKIRYCYLDEDDLMAQNSISPTEVTSIHHSNEPPIVVVTKTERHYLTQWWIFRAPGTTEESYSYDFYIPEGSYIDLNYERWLAD